MSEPADNPIPPAAGLAAGTPPDAAPSPTTQPGRRDTAVLDRRTRWVSSTVPPVAPRSGPRPAPGRRLRRWILAPLLLLIAAGSGLLVVDLVVTLSAHHAIVEDLDQIEPAPVALLLGTARTHQGRPNQFYRARIDTAAALFHSGKVRGILVSGDNATPYYNEPLAMQEDLTALGVTPEFITMDYAGFRTLDSIIRAKKVFGVDRLIIVSQRFHAARAIFLARHYGLEASALAAPSPPPSWSMRVRAREVLARVAAILDLATGRGPRFLGAPETVRLREPRERSGSA